MSRFRAMAALVPAAYSVEDSKQYASLATQAFDIGVGLFDEDSAAGRAQRHKGFEELMNLVLFSASQPADVLRAKIQELPDAWLKAYLWLYEAEGHGKQRPQAQSDSTCSK